MIRLGIVAHRRLAIVSPIVSTNSPIGVHDNGSTAERGKGGGAIDVGVHRHPCGRLRGIVAFGEGGVLVKDHGPNDFAVQAFGGIEETVIAEAHQQKTNAKEIVGRLSKFQELFERVLEEQRRTIDEKFENVEEQAVARKAE
jgi:hypothetical protein